MSGNKKTPVRRGSRLVVPVALAFLAAGCTTPPSQTDRSSPPVRTSGSTPTAHSSPSVAGRVLTLRASLDAPLASWTEVAFLPGGTAEDEIGIDPCSECEPLVPAALAVGKDGTFWIADSYKRRIAHFAKDGSFLGAIPVEKGPADLTFAGDHLYALPEELGSVIAVSKSGGISGTITVNNEGKPLHVYALIGGQDHLLALIAGAQKILGGYWALAEVDPITGQVTPAPGVQTPGGTYMDLVPLLGTRPLLHEIRWSDGAQVTSRLEVGFQLLHGDTQLRTSVGDTYVRTSTADGVATLVNMSSGQGLTARWYLEIPADGRRPIFERFPDEGFMGDALRSLTVGPDGSVYWMRLLQDGLHVYRR